MNPTTDGSADVPSAAAAGSRAAPGPQRLGLPGNDVQLSALRWSSGAATPPSVLLHHGLASSAGFWGPVATQLARGEPGDGVIAGASPGVAGDFAPGRDVVALDARGHGESDRPDDGFDMATVAADLHAALTALGWASPGGNPPVLVGHSWGGNVVLEYATRHPEVAAGIVLVDGGFLELGQMSWEQTERELAPPSFGVMTWPEFAARATGWWGAAGWTPAVEDAIHHNFEDLPDGTVRPRLSRERHMRILRGMWEQRPADLYSAVRCPVFMVPARRAGAEGREREFIARKVDAVSRAEATLRGAGVPVTVEWFEDSVHDIPLQRPARLASRVQAFIGTLPTPRGDGR
ncbi:MAG TPA: alpha/beta fold hydrolase [Candidatus Acidoferrales bacterium]|nr:alpha/beta fold hydrolase [Candidatus Acidoferrales bacterium]